MCVDLKDGVKCVCKPGYTRNSDTELCEGKFLKEETKENRKERENSREEIRMEGEKEIQKKDGWRIANFVTLHLPFILNLI